MRQSFVRVAAVLVLLGGATALVGCSSDEPLAPFVEIPAEQSYNAGIAYLRQGDYTNATKKFAEVDEQHPYSEWARKSLIMTTYTNYTRGNFDEAITQAKRYLTLYPGSEDAAYAQWMIAQSYFNQMPDITRDQKLDPAGHAGHAGNWSTATPTAPMPPKAASASTSPRTSSPARKWKSAVTI